VLLAAALAGGCVSNGGTGPGGAGPATAGLIGSRPAPAAPKSASPTPGGAALSDAAAEALQKAVSLVAFATPSSLAAAQWAAQDATRAGAADGAAAAAAAATLLAGLYQDAAAPAGPGTAAGGAVSAPTTISDPFLQKVVPALIVLDRRATVGDSAAADLRQKLADAAALRKDSPLPPYLLGLLFERTHDSVAERRAQFEEALRRLPGFVPAVVELMDTIIASGSGAAAKELPYLQKLAAALPDVEQSFRALVRVDLAAGEPGMAADAAARGMLEAPDGPQGADMRVRFALLRASALEASGDWYQSLLVLDALLKLDPGLADATLAKARILHEDAGNDADALALISDAAARDPQNSGYPELKARILLDQGRVDEAQAELGRAHDLDPGSVSVLTLLASVAARTGRWDDASSWLSQVPASSQGPEQLRLSWRVATAQGAHDKALAAAEQLFQLTDSVEALALEARSMIAAGRAADARVVIDHALGTQGPTPALASELHALRARAGSADPLSDLRTALRENPDNVEALDAISDALAAQKDYRKAMEYARRASALDPTNATLARKAAVLARQAADQAANQSLSSSTAPSE
ncbi:MAG TPA: tetratricopeptide repeat protein, partial [Spirochaetia bacterium]|nr:tetratricopeptide repeat protein [Spirochaetia bacterium]